MATTQGTKRSGGGRSVDRHRSTAVSASIVVVGLIAVILGLVLTVTDIGWIALEGGRGVHPLYLHDLAFITLLGVALLGLLVQVCTPIERIGASQQAVFVADLLIGFILLAGQVVPPGLVLVALAADALTLHPAGREVLWELHERSFSKTVFSR